MTLKVIWYLKYNQNSMVSCQKGPTRHAYAWQIGPFWQNTLEMFNEHVVTAVLQGPGVEHST